MKQQKETIKNENFISVYKKYIEYSSKDKQTIMIIIIQMI